MTLPPGPQIRGFLPDHEGKHLHQLATEVAHLGPMLEIGSYCGRSTIWLGHAARSLGSVVFALDHHRGSEEHQPGEFFHDAALADVLGGIDTLAEFRRNIANAQLEDHVIALVGASTVVGKQLPQGDFSLVFIDGGHSLDAALEDWRAFGTRVCRHGLLVIHDVFDSPALGGQAPHTIWQMAVASGLFAEHSRCDSLRALRRL
jgi:predicted O-methyltransferase YrrM